jgi:hypothetical protein
MFRKLTQSVCVLLGLMAARQAGAFVISGPAEAWQLAVMDYSNPLGTARYYYQFVDVNTGLGYIEWATTKNIGEGSRLTTPIITYGFDDTFLQYFGVEGEKAVEAAMAVMNALPSASTANLGSFLTTGAQQINYTAQAASLLDIKSTVMWLMIEHMGLLGETHVFDLSLRYKYGPPICAYDYFVINRNYDPVTYDPTAYVNGRQYSYGIWDGCSIGVPVADAIETSTDTTSPRYTAVATPEGLQLGGYYLGMSRDDMGGLKYLYGKDNYAFQSLDSNAIALPFESSYSPVNTTNPITGISNFSGLMGGVEKVTFVKVEYDSLLNPTFAPITYNYSVPWVTNSHLYQLKVTRTITAPDILFTAANLVLPGDIPNDVPLDRTSSFIQTTYVSPGGGVTPSTMSAPMLITLNNIGPIEWDYNPYFMDSANYYEYPIFNWGSFDGSTNAPIVFPVGYSLEELEAQVVQGGPPLPVYPWAPVLNPATNTDTNPGGGGGGAPPP